MFSKFWILLVLAFIFIGCENFKFNEDPPKQKVIVPNATGLDCVDSSLNIAEKFFSGEAEVVEVKAFWTCARKALVEFKTKVQGQKSGVYETEELRKFLNDYYAKDVELTSEFMNQAMKIKKIFIGGNEWTLSSKDIDQTIHQYIPAFEDLTLELLPYMKVYTQEWTPNTDSKTDLEFFERSNTQLQKFIFDLSAVIMQNGDEYQLNDFVLLLKEIEIIFSKKWPITENVEKYLPIFEKLKRNFLGGSEKAVANIEWDAFLNLGLRSYMQYLRYFYFIEPAESDFDKVEQVPFLINTFSDSMTLLGQALESKPGQKINQQEVLEVLYAVSQFFPELKYSDKLIEELFRLKVLVVSGELTFLSPDDFYNALSKTESLQKVLLLYFPVSDVLSFNWIVDGLVQSDLVQKYLLTDQNLKLIAEELPVFLNGSYDLKNLDGILEEVIQLYPDYADVSALLYRWQPVLVAAKKIISPVGDSTVLVSQWPLLAKVSAEAYAHAIYGNYLIVEDDFVQMIQTDLFADYINRITGTVDHIIRSQPAQVVSFAQLDQLVESFYTRQAIAFKFRAESLNKSIRALVQKVLLQPHERLTQPTVQGLSLSSTAFLRQEFFLYSESRRFLDLLFQNWNSDLVNKAQLLPAYLQQLQSMGDSVNLLGVRELYAVLNSPMTLLQDQDRSIVFDRISMQFYNRFSVDQFNAYRLISRWMIRSYATDLRRAQDMSGIIEQVPDESGRKKTLQEATAILNDYRDLLVDLEVIEKSNTGFGAARYIEANLFTPQSDGNDRVGQLELTGLVAMIMSGLKTDEYMQSDLSQLCAMQSLPGTSNKTAEIGCFRRAYFQLIQMKSDLSEGFKHFRNMPEFSNYASRLSPSAWTKFIINLEKSAGYNGKDPQIKQTDFSLIPHVVQYIEMMMFRFDSNRDGFLSTAESKQSLPLLREQLKEVSGLDSDKNLFAVLTYFLKHGEPPSTLQFIFWKLKGEKDWNVNADRAQLAAILGYIQEEAAKQERDRRLREDLKDSED